MISRREKRDRARASRSRRSAAFTLVELLIAIGVIAVLVGILLPALSRARQMARTVVCANNLRTLGHGMLAYAGSFDGVLPWEGYAEGDRPKRHLGPWEEPSTWFNAAPKYAGLRPYCELQAAATAGGASLPHAGDAYVFVCPEAEIGPGDSEDVATDDGYLMFWGLDRNGTPVQRKTFWCYGYNTQLDGGVEDRNVNYRVTVNLNQLKHPTEIVLLAEKLMRANEINPVYPGSVGQQEISSKEFTGRHHGGGHILFGDGHVAYFTRQAVSDSPLGPNQPGTIVWDPRFGSK